MSNLTPSSTLFAETLQKSLFSDIKLDTQMFPVGKLDARPLLAETPVECRRKHNAEDCGLIKFCSLFTEYVSTRTFEKQPFLYSHTSFSCLCGTQCIQVCVSVCA